MVKARFNIILMLLLLVGIWFRVSEFTDADILDQVRIPGNRISMMSISLASKKTTNGLNITTLLHTDDLRPDGFDVGAIRVTQNSSATLNYRLTTQKKSGDDGLCQSLNLDVYKNHESMYRGKLQDVSLISNLDQGSRNDWIFVVSLPSHNTDLIEKVCNMDFVFSTKKDNQQGGLYGESRVGNSISTGTW